MAILQNQPPFMLPESSSFQVPKKYFLSGNSDFPEIYYPFYNYRRPVLASLTGWRPEHPAQSPKTDNKQEQRS